MNKQEYLNELNRHLGNMPDSDRNDILYDYEEHFRIGIENGKTEEEISKSLGDVESVARQFLGDYTIKQADNDAPAGNIFKAVIAAIALGFFNLMFILGPYVGLVGVLAGLFAASIALVVSGVGIVLGLVLFPLLPSFINLGGMDLGFLIFASVGIICLGLLFLIGSCYIAKYFFKGTARYLKWNLEVIKGRRIYNV